jgi:hypothetical protein
MTPEQQTQHANRLEGKIAQLEALCETLRFSAKTGNSKDIISVCERMVYILVDISEKENIKPIDPTISAVVTLLSQQPNG